MRINSGSGDQVLKEHFQNCGKNATYVSWRIQNEVISIVNDLVQQKIASKVNNAQCFSVLVDETSDISRIEQVSITLRYVEGETLREDFLQFFPTTIATGQALANIILEKLKELNIDIEFLYGQGYDGASVMSGEFKGVQAIIKEHSPKALYVHCSAHALNLAISDSCNIPDIRNTVGVISKVYNFFNTPKRQAILKKKH